MVGSLSSVKLNMAVTSGWSCNFIKLLSKFDGNFGITCADHKKINCLLKFEYEMLSIVQV